MLETKFKVLFLLAVLAFAAIPIMGILRGTTLTPFEKSPADSTDPTPSGSPEPSQVSREEPVQEEMVSIPAGPFIRGTDQGGLDEQPHRTLVLDAFAIDRYEVTNFQYQQFVDATGHRKSGPPSRYAKNMTKMQGINQPVVYVSWEDAEAYCHWKGKRLPTEAEWEKAMRGPDGRLWPWGNVEQPNGANWARVQDGHDVSASVGTVSTDKSPYGVMDGAGNVMERVADWYADRIRRALITAYFGCSVGGGMRPREPIFVSPAGARWFPTFAMKRSGFAVRNLVRNQRGVERENHMKLIRNQSSRE